MVFQIRCKTALLVLQRRSCSIWLPSFVNIRCKHTLRLFFPPTWRAFPKTLKQLWFSINLLDSNLSVMMFYRYQSIICQFLHFFSFWCLLFQGNICIMFILSKGCLQIRFLYYAWFISHKRHKATNIYIYIRGIRTSGVFVNYGERLPSPRSNDVSVGFA